MKIPKSKSKKANRFTNLKMEFVLPIKHRTSKAKERERREKEREREKLKRCPRC